MIYKRKLETIEAFQWTGDQDQKEDPEWIVECIKAGIVWFENEGTPNCVMVVQSYGREVRIVPGNYVIRGSCYPWSLTELQFNSIYEPL